MYASVPSIDGHPHSAVIKALFPAYNFVSALAVAACLTPTDPIICAAIVGQSHLFSQLEDSTEPV